MIMLRFFIIFLLSINIANARYENYAAMAINTKDGEVLYSQNPDKKVHLASITKLMTLYLAFEALQDGRMSINDKVIISNTAAKQLPISINLIEGKKYSIKEMILSTAIFSANDAAVTLAEEIAGNVEDFVYLMNKKAKQLGLNNTQYGNATGMPDSINYSTPKDIINLIQMLRQDFPQYYTIFSIELLAQRGKIYSNSNKLLPYFKGMDGVKTGFTDIAGRNLACSFKYNDHNIISVVFGMSNRTERDKHMKEIMDYSVKKVLSRKMIKDEKTNDMILEYDHFLKTNDIKVVEHGLYFTIFNNIFDQSKQNKNTIASLDRKSISILDKALSEISGFGDLMSYPLPIIND